MSLLTFLSKKINSLTYGGILKNNYNYILEQIYNSLISWCKVAIDNIIDNIENYKIEDNLRNGFMWLSKNLFDVSISIWVPIIMLFLFLGYMWFNNFFVKQ